MRKRAAKLFIAAGAVLITASLLLALYNILEARKAGKDAERLLGAVKEVVAQLPTPALPDTPLPAEMPVTEVDGYGIIGFIALPELGIELPVMDQWDYQRLTKAPCRHFGSSRTDDLVIAAHNYESHFKRLSELSEGSEAIFTDMEGYENRYILQRLQTLQSDAVDAVRDSGCDLVLYTCTPGGAARVAAFFNRAE